MLIGTFWQAHHRIFEHIEHPSEVVQGLNFLWMLGIVFFPVIAAVLGLDPADTTQKVLYIGCMMLCSVSLNAILWQSKRDPRIRGELPLIGAGYAAASFGSTLLYTLALVLALLIPGGLGYFALFVLGFMPVAVRLLVPVVRRGGLGL